MSESSQKKQLEAYVNQIFAQEDDVLQRVMREAAANDIPPIGIHPFEGRLLQFLAQMIGAKKILEIGTLAGYSGIWLARALPDGGKLITIEFDDKHANIAQQNFDHANLTDKVKIKRGAALDILPTLEAPFDLIFIDADKPNYLQYLEWGIKLVRQGGIVIAHNALTSDDRPRVLGSDEAGDKEVVAYNQAIANDERVNSMIISAGEGFAVAMKV